MVNMPVLKIESENETLLVSRRAKQELCPILKNNVVKNINSVPIKIGRKMKFKSIIETKDDVNIAVLSNCLRFKIYSIVRFSCESKPPPGKFVEDSIEENEKALTFRPILDMILTNFNCKADTNGEQFWRLEFEEI